MGVFVRGKEPILRGSYLQGRVCAPRFSLSVVGGCGGIQWVRQVADLGVVVIDCNG